MKHDLHGAMSRTLTEQQMNDLAQALHSSWPRKASDIKKKSAVQQMDIDRGGVMSQKEGKDGLNLKLALSYARSDPRVQQEIQQRLNNNKARSGPFSPRQHGYTSRRRASTLATPGQDIDSSIVFLQNTSERQVVQRLDARQQPLHGSG